MAGLLTTEDGAHVLVVLGGSLSGQGGYVLLYEGAHGLLVELTHDDEGELRGVLEAVLVDLEDAVVADVLEVLDVEVGEARVVAVEGVGERVAEDAVGGEVLVLEGHLQLSHEVLVLLLVLVDGGEVEVHHLEHGLEVLGRGVGGDVLAGESQRGVGVDFLPARALVSSLLEKLPMPLMPMTWSKSFRLL